jgi:hypothetical protein
MFQKTDITFDRCPADARERWQTVRAVVSGDQAMRAGKYLPTLNAQDKSLENESRNSAYVQRAVFYNATGRTLDGLIGLAFKRAPSGDMPPVLDYLLRNADGRGNSIYQQSQATLASVMMTGRHGLYIDYDNAQRPCIKSYAAETIINWRYQDGKLSMVVLKESAEVTDGYGVSEVDQWRELALENGQCVCRIWRMGDKGEPVQQAMTDSNGREVAQVVVRSRGHVLGYIPFQFVGSRNNDDGIDSAPLYDLARLNVAHFRNSADYEDSVFYTGQAQPWGSGVTADFLEDTKQNGLYVGARSVIWLPQGGAFGFAQPSPNTLVKEAMDQKEAQMIALGARLIDQTAIAVTATQNENDREASTSVLSMCASNVNEAYQNALLWCADMLDKPITLDEASGAFKISQDYARMKIDATAVSALVSAWQSGAIGLPDLRAYLRSEGVIAPERDDDMIDGDLEAQGPQLGNDATDTEDMGNSAKSAMQAQEASPPTPFDATPPARTQLAHPGRHRS